MPTYAAERSRAAIYFSVYDTRKRLKLAETDEARASLSALLARHEADLAACDAAKPPPPPAGKKICSKCKAVLERNEHNFVRRKDRRSSWYSECRECTNARRRDIIAARAAPVPVIESDPMPTEWRRCRRCGHRKSPAEFKLAKGGRLTTCCTHCLDLKAAVKRAARLATKAASAEVSLAAPAASVKPKPGPKPKEHGLLAEELARKGREREIVLLIARYEAVRPHPGPDRTAAYNTLGLALQRHGRPVSDGVREWEWAKGLGEVTSRLLRREWKPPEDRHADPKRVARGY